MGKRLKNKPDSPTESASTTVPQVRQEDEPHPIMVNREMNKPFTLVIAIPNDAEMSAVFSPLAVETAVFPVDRNNKTLHTFIVNKITDMTADAMKPFFEFQVRSTKLSIALSKNTTSAMLPEKNTSGS